MKNKKLKIISFFIALFLICFLIIFLVLYSPQKLVDSIGINNSFLILFLMAVFGGVSAFTSASFYATMVTFYIGGLNFFALIIIGAMGLTLGDFIFYYLGKRSRDFVSETSYKKKINSLKKFMKKIPDKFVFLLIFLYVGVSPLPKDVLCVFLGINDFPKTKFFILFFLGNLLFNFLFLFLISRGFDILIF